LIEMGVFLFAQADLKPWSSDFYLPRRWDTAQTIESGLHYFLKYSLFPSCTLKFKTYIMYILVPLMVSDKSLSLSGFVIIHFSLFLFLDDFNWLIFKFSHSVFCLLKFASEPSTEFFVLVIILFNLIISI
jgi:hypothetical protein